MRSLIQYIRQCFCKHDFEYTERLRIIEDNEEKVEEKYLMVSRTCKKCAWHKKYKKF